MAFTLEQLRSGVTEKQKEEERNKNAIAVNKFINDKISPENTNAVVNDLSKAADRRIEAARQVSPTADPAATGELPKMGNQTIQPSAPTTPANNQTTTQLTGNALNPIEVQKLMGLDTKAINTQAVRSSPTSDTGGFDPDQIGTDIKKVKTEAAQPATTPLTESEQKNGQGVMSFPTTVGQRGRVAITNREISNDSLASQRDSVANMDKLNRTTDADVAVWKAQNNADVMRNDIANLDTESNRITGRPGPFSSQATQAAFLEKQKGLNDRKTQLLDLIGKTGNSGADIAGKSIAANADATTAQATNRFAFDKWQYEQAQKPLDRASDRTDKMDVATYEAINKAKADNMKVGMMDPETAQFEALFSNGANFYDGDDGKKYYGVVSNGKPLPGAVPVTPSWNMWMANKKKQPTVQAG